MKNISIMMMLISSLAFPIFSIAEINSIPQNVSKDPLSSFRYMNDLDEELVSISIRNQCTVGRYGVFPPHNGHNIDNSDIRKNFCKQNPFSCKLEFHISKDCSGNSIGYAELDLQNGHDKFIYIAPGGKYRILDTSPSTGSMGEIRIQDKRGPHIKYYSVGNFTNEDVTFSVNGYCSALDNLVFPAHGIGGSYTITQFCKNTQGSCRMDLYMSKDCTGASPGYILLDTFSGIKGIYNDRTSKYDNHFQRGPFESQTQFIYFKYK